jgi:predicted nucleotide-binding protein
MTVNRLQSADSGVDVSRRVFVVHGRDHELKRSFYGLLHSLDLRPMDWEDIVAGTGVTAPYTGDVVACAPHLAQATLVLLSPDDIVQLHSDLRFGRDPTEHRACGAQPRPNVLLELGMALMAYPNRTIIVKVGNLRPIGDLGGRNYIDFDATAATIKKIVERLTLAGCRLDDSGTDWLDISRFAGLTAFGRGPASHCRAEIGIVCPIRRAASEDHSASSCA